MLTTSTKTGWLTIQVICTSSEFIASCVDTKVSHYEKYLHEIFYDLDQNHDDELDISDLRGYFKNNTELLHSEEITQLFKDLDVHHKGSITFEEFKAYMKDQIFSQISSKIDEFHS